ncbi:carboxypeptidase regulatory-like domain-containing protein [Candidatus Woesearchaeota archaeon]|jgi:hypothetical protein|nr:carboxypeptidase regulatory-like domain-containing protein [Candidatus Woesearchaeota archaeon]MBT4387607.1 carboxypeptidase regulatory-like domain-containing protein [Candidatus Woesearchaeota archaeon]MBT4596031.1 carboxypeptidase regulatory-like domain-containing protein [Candidatus Woesearchaeota archaeon]MBT5740739.1 carboxypeptidase regulatory-like domain-containing protein [Candidatus Woesearchaeota archaeon]MBT7296513.1 carboxypeptidase regulatory-like domain-containing protein [Cand
MKKKGLILLFILIFILSLSSINAINTSGVYLDDNYAISDEDWRYGFINTLVNITRGNDTGGVNIGAYQVNITNSSDTVLWSYLFDNMSIVSDNFTINATFLAIDNIEENYTVSLYLYNSTGNILFENYSQSDTVFVNITGIDLDSIDDFNDAEGNLSFLINFTRATNQTNIDYYEVEIFNSSNDELSILTFTNTSKAYHEYNFLGLLGTTAENFTANVFAVHNATHTDPVGDSENFVDESGSQINTTGMAIDNSFADTDASEGSVSGFINFTRAMNESNILYYEIEIENSSLDLVWETNFTNLSINSDNFSATANFEATTGNGNYTIYISAYDAETGIVGDNLTFEDYINITYNTSGMSLDVFSDDNQNNNQIYGLINFSRATNESNINFYTLEIETQNQVVWNYTFDNDTIVSDNFSVNVNFSNDNSGANYTLNLKVSSDIAETTFATQQFTDYSESCGEFNGNETACFNREFCEWSYHENTCLDSGSSSNLDCGIKTNETACHESGFCEWDSGVQQCFNFFHQSGVQCWAEFYDPNQDQFEVDKNTSVYIVVPIPDETSNCVNFDLASRQPYLDLWGMWDDDFEDDDCESVGPDGFCQKEPKFTCSAYEQGELNADNSSWIFNVSGLAPDNYELSVQVPFGCEEAFGSIGLIQELDGDEVLNLTFGGVTSATGLVVEEDGNPMAYPNIDAYSKEGGSGYAWADGGADGNFTLYGLGVGNYTLSISDQNWSRWYETQIEILNDSVDLGNITFGAGAGVNGYVKLSNNPQQYVWVSLRSKAEGINFNDPNYWHSVKFYGGSTDSNGYYSISGVEAGEYLIEVWPSYGSDATPFEGTVTVDSENKTEYNISLSAGNLIYGRVINDTGHGVEGMSVNTFVEMDWDKMNYEDCQYCGPGYWGWEMTNSTGHYRISGLKPAEFVVEVMPNTWFDESLKSYKTDRRKVELESGEVEANFTLETGIALSGFIFNSSNDPITCGWINAWVQEDDGNEHSRPTDWAWSNINNDGSYSLNGVKTSTEYEIYIEPCYQLNLGGKNDRFTISENTEINYTLTQGGSIKGLVVNSDNEPVSGATVQTWLPHGGGWGHSRTEQDGTFKIKGLSSSTSSEKYELEVFSNDYSFFRITDIEVNDGQETDIGTIKLGGGSTLSGVVKYANDTVIENAFVNVWCESSFGHGYDETNSTGHYEIEGLPNCEYKLFMDVPSTYEHFFNDSVTIADDLEYNITLQSFDLVNINGKIKSTDGTNLSNAFISVFNPTLHSGGYNETDENGTYYISNIPEGEGYEFSIMRFDYEGNYSDNETINSTNLEFNFSLAPINLSAVFNITGEIFNSANNVTIVAINDIDSLITKHSSSNSTYKISDLPHGNYKVYAVKGETEIEYPTLVNQGASSGVDFDFE